MSSTLVLILILIVLLSAVLTFAYIQYKLNKELKNELQSKTADYSRLYEEYELYRKSEQFKHQEEEKANEKINDLHTGTVSADDILPKR